MMVRHGLGEARCLRWLAVGVALLARFGWPCAMAEADLLAQTPQEPLSPAQLDPAAERRADAMAWYAQALFEEETSGPDKAIESFRKSLALDPSNEDLALRLSQDFLRRGETTEAITTLKDSLKARPKSADLAVALSLIYLRHLHKPDLALRYATQAAGMAPPRIGPWEMLVEIHLSQKQLSKALAALDQAARSKTDDPTFWLGLAELAGRIPRDATTGDRLQARFQESMKKAVALAAGDADLLARAGDLHAVAHDVASAVACYRQAAAIKASLPRLRERLALGLAEIGRTSEAISVFEEIIQLDPLNLQAYDGLSQLHLKEGNLSKAAACARQALLLEPQAPDRHLFVADLLFRLKDYAQAAATLAEARKLFPMSPQLTQFHAVALSQCKKHDEAMRTFALAEKQALDWDPTLLGADFYFDYGAAAEQAGLVDDAERLFQKSIAQDPSGAARSYNYLGYMWVDRNMRLEDAEQMIRRAVEMDPNNGAYQDSLGWLLFKQGKTQDALDTLLRASERLAEPDPVVFDHIGDACEKLGRVSEAILYWKKALALDPENSVIAKKLDARTDAVVQQPKAEK